MNKPTIILVDEYESDGMRFIEYDNDALPEAGYYALLRLVPCGTCGGTGSEYTDCCYQGPPCGHNRPCPEFCWDGWVPKDGTREIRCDNGHMTERCGDCRWVWVLPERTD